MTNAEVLALAEEIVEGRCTATIHKGDRPNAAAVRLSGGFLREVEEIGVELAARLPGELRSSGGFVAVWFDRRDVAARLLHDRVGEPPMLDYDEAMYG